MGQILHIQSAMDMLGGDLGLLKELLQDFLSEKAFDKAKMQSLLKRDDEEAAKYIHYIKGAARQLGAERLAHSGQELEDVLRHKKAGSIAPLIQAFDSDYRETQHAVQEALSIL